MPALAALFPSCACICAFSAWAICRFRASARPPAPGRAGAESWRFPSYAPWPAPAPCAAPLLSSRALSSTGASPFGSHSPPRSPLSPRALLLCSLPPPSARSCFLRRCLLSPRPVPCVAVHSALSAPPSVRAPLTSPFHAPPAGPFSSRLCPPASPFASPVSSLPGPCLSFFPVAVPSRLPSVAPSLPLSRFSRLSFPMLSSLSFPPPDPWGPPLLFVPLGFPCLLALPLRPFPDPPPWPCCHSRPSVRFSSLPPPPRALPPLASVCVSGSSRPSDARSCARLVPPFCLCARPAPSPFRVPARRPRLGALFCRPSLLSFVGAPLPVPLARLIFPCGFACAPSRGVRRPAYRLLAVPPASLVPCPFVALWPLLVLPATVRWPLPALLSACPPAFFCVPFPRLCPACSPFLPRLPSRPRPSFFALLSVSPPVLLGCPFPGSLLLCLSSLLRAPFPGPRVRAFTPVSAPPGFAFSLSRPAARPCELPFRPSPPPQLAI